jgi:hypothetical protein
MAEPRMSVRLLSKPPIHGVTTGRHCPGALPDHVRDSDERFVHGFRRERPAG